MATKIVYKDPKTGRNVSVTEYNKRALVNRAKNVAARKTKLNKAKNAVGSKAVKRYTQRQDVKIATYDHKIKKLVKAPKKHGLAGKPKSAAHRAAISAGMKKHHASKTKTRFGNPHGITPTGKIKKGYKMVGDRIVKTKSRAVNKAAVVKVKGKVLTKKKK